MIRFLLDFVGVFTLIGIGIGIYELRRHGVTLAMVKAAIADLKKGG